MENELPADENVTVCFIVLAFKNPASELRKLFDSLESGSIRAGVSSKNLLISNDDQFESSALPGVEVHCGHGNVGFAAGIKLGVDLARSDYVVIANPDTSITESDAFRFISELVKQDGVLVPILRDEAGEVAYASYEDWVFVAGRQYAKRVCRRFVMEGADEYLPRWVRICGAFLGMPTEIARNYGPFDEAFFMYGEDRDLTSRLRRDNIGIRLLRTSSVTHVGGGSGSGLSRELAVFRADSAVRIAYRRYGKLGARLKFLDLWLDARRKRGPARAYALEARRTVITRWGRCQTEAPRLEFAQLK